MKCSRVRVNLLDYSRGLLNGPEYEQITSHLNSCADCAAFLREEEVFASRLAAMPLDEPTNDVWTLVRARTRPRRLRMPAWLRVSAISLKSRRILAGAAAAAAAVTLYSYTLKPVTPTPTSPSTSAPPVVVKWSDDPLGNHTDAMVKLIDEM